MKLRIIHGCPIFYPESGTETAYIIKKYEAVHIANVDGYVPADLIPYLFGFQEDDTYSYYYDYLLREGKKYNLDEAKLTEKHYLNEGYYRVGTNMFGGLDMRDITLLDYTYEILGKPPKLLNKPLHKEVIDSNDTIPTLASNAGTLFKQINDFVKVYQDDKAKTDTAITNIVTTIKTIPAVVGSPLNPTLVATPVNTTENIVVTIGSKVDEFSDYANDLENFINDIKEVIEKK